MAIYARDSATRVIERTRALGDFSALDVPTALALAPDTGSTTWSSTATWTFLECTRKARSASTPCVNDAAAAARVGLQCPDTEAQRMAAPVSRRDFTRLFAIGGSAALFADPVWARQARPVAALAPGSAASGEAFWTNVREQFVMPPDLAVMNAANLCPSSRPVLETLTKRDARRRFRPLALQSRAADAGEGGNAQGAGRVPPRDARRDHHHAQHQRVEQPGVERARSQGRRRGGRSCRQSPEQPECVAREGQALRLHGGDRRAEESASGDGLLRRRLHPGDDAAHEDASPSRISAAPSAT